jgi:hypothetical protein
MGNARDWQKTDPDLRTHPAFAHLCALLDLKPIVADGLLSGLWRMAYRKAEDGYLTRFKPGAIAAAIGYEGNAREMLAALTESGFLEVDDVGLHVHDWADWGGALYAYRERKRENQAAYRGGHVAVTSPLHDHEVTACSRTRRVKSKSKVKVQPIAASSEAAAVVETVDNLDLVLLDAPAKAPGDGFDAFWSAYPNKQGKVPALRTWKHLKPDERSYATTVAAAMAGAVERGYRERDKCPYGSTFLNQRRWEEWGEGPPPGYGPNGKPSTNLTTEQARPTCVVCAHILTADEQMEAVHTRKGWRHESCVREEP